MHHILDKLIDTAGAFGHTIPEFDQKILIIGIENRIALGWDPHDVYLYLRSTEHVMPGLDEDVALERMRQVEEYVNEYLPRKMPTC